MRRTAICCGDVIAALSERPEANKARAIIAAKIWRYKGDVSWHRTRRNSLHLSLVTLDKAYSAADDVAENNMRPQKYYRRLLNEAQIIKKAISKIIIKAVTRAGPSEC